MYLGVPFSKQHKDRMYLREGNFSLNCLYKGHQHSLHVVALVCVIKRAVTLSQTGTYKKSSSSTYMLKMSKKKKKGISIQKSFADFHLLLFCPDPIVQICQASTSFGYLIHKCSWSNTLATAGLAHAYNIS